MPRRGVVPRFSDLEVIALSLTAEKLSIDSESLLISYLQDYKDEMPNIRLEVPYRLNQKDWKPTFAPFAKARKRVETLFSQMVDQFATA